MLATNRYRPAAPLRLLSGQTAKSGNDRYALTYQSDGNLVLIDTQTRGVLWSSGAQSGPGQDTGDFVIYAASDQVIWHAVR